MGGGFAFRVAVPRFKADFNFGSVFHKAHKLSQEDLNAFITKNAKLYIKSCVVRFSLYVGAAVLRQPQDRFRGKTRFAKALFFRNCFGVLHAFYFTRHTWLHVELGGM
jgi:hypothetical protein